MAAPPLIVVGANSVAAASAGDETFSVPLPAGAQVGDYAIAVKGGFGWVSDSRFTYLTFIPFEQASAAVLTDLSDVQMFTHFGASRVGAVIVLRPDPALGSFPAFSATDRFFANSGTGSTDVGTFSSDPIPGTNSYFPLGPATAGVKVLSQSGGSGFGATLPGEIVRASHSGSEALIVASSNPIPALSIPGSYSSGRYVWSVYWNLTPAPFVAVAAAPNMRVGFL
jgi:hypothetical protein